MQQYQPEDWLSEVKDFLESTGMQHFVYKLVGYSYKIFWISFNISKDTNSFPIRILAYNLFIVRYLSTKQSRYKSYIPFKAHTELILFVAFRWFSTETTTYTTYDAQTITINLVLIVHHHRHSEYVLVILFVVARTYAQLKVPMVGHPHLHPHIPVHGLVVAQLAIIEYIVAQTSRNAKKDGCLPIQPWKNIN